MTNASPALPFSRDASQSDRAILGIRDMVLRGDFKAGDRLPELSLVELLGVSRTPIRAALQKLAEEGLLAVAQPTGYVVRSFSETEIFDAIEVRGTIEGLAARMAAERGISRLQLDDMRDCLARIDSTLLGATEGDDHLIRYSALNLQFHELMVSASGSEMVARALARITSLPFAAPDSFVLAQAQMPGSLEILRTSQAQHHEILDAIEARSSARVEPLVREHSRNARRSLELVLRNGEALKRVAGAQLIRRRTAA